MSRFNPIQIASILNEWKPADEIVREIMELVKPPYVISRKLYGGIEASELKKINELEEENAKLKRVYSNLALELDTAKFIIEQKL